MTTAEKLHEIAKDKDIQPGWCLSICAAALELERNQDTIAQVRKERDEFKRERDDLKAKPAQVEADCAAMREALLKWKAYFQSDVPMNRDAQEQSGEDFTNAWFGAEDAIKSGSGQALLDELAELKQRTKHYPNLLQDIADMRKEADTLRATAQRRLEFLKKCEWTAWAGTSEMFCPYCSLNRKEGHKQDCPLAAELKEAK